MNTKFYVTTPIYYATAAPHLGSLYSTLLADVFARYHKLAGQDTHFLVGTDEHGQKIAQAAQAAGKDPQTFLDACIPSYKAMWQKYNLAYDYFIRTTDEAHKQAVQMWIQNLMDKGDIYKDSYVGWYCTPDESFVTPKDSAEGTKKDEAPLCPDCGRVTIQVSEECYFFRLSAYQEKLLAFYESHPDFITPKERMAEVVAFVKGGLKDLSISRSTISWGIPFPGDSKHVTYVWADALNNYITAVGYGDNKRAAELAKWWPADMQILGKDIVRFHAVYWPAFLMASGLALPKKLLVHGWIKVDSQKMSKSLGNAVEPGLLADTYGVDEIRYYLTRKMAVTQDSEFKFEDIEQSIESELANALGNLLNRMTMLAEKYQYMNIESRSQWGVAEQALQAQACVMVQETWVLVEQGMSHRVVARVWDFINQVNAYFHEQQPWKVVKDDQARFQEIIAATAQCVRVIGIMLWPVMPTKMELMLASIGHSIEPGKDYITELKTMSWKDSCMLQKIATLFTKPEKKEEVASAQPQAEQKPAAVQNVSCGTQPKSGCCKEEPKDDGLIDITQFMKMDLRIGTIIACEAVEGSDKLIKSQVDFGDLGKRQILSGVKKWLSPESMVGKQALFVVNLPERKMLGHVSQGMMLVVHNGQDMVRVVAEEQVTSGSKVS